jgi:hypothetical protein
MRFRTLRVFPLRNTHSKCIQNYKIYTQRSDYTLRFLREWDNFTEGFNYISFRCLQNLVTFSDFLVQDKNKWNGENDLNRTCSRHASPTHPKENEHDELPSHISNPVHFVNCLYSSVGSSESSEGASDDNGPKMPSELRVNPLCEEVQQEDDSISSAT